MDTLKNKNPGYLPGNVVQNLLFCNETFRVQCCHECLACRAEYRAVFADRVVANDIGEARRVLIHGRRVYEGLDGLYQRLAAFAGHVEGRFHFLQLMGRDGQFLPI